MKELFLNPNRCCSVSGHRVIDKLFDKDNLKEIFLKIIDNGYNTFLIGMALGFDTLCFNILSEIRKKKDIKIIACIPCINQDLHFNLKQKKEYDNMLVSADEKVYVSQEYNDRCMQKRNEYLVDNSSLLVAYIRRNYGGTYNTIKYAQQKNIMIINV